MDQKSWSFWSRHKTLCKIAGVFICNRKAGKLVENIPSIIESAERIARVQAKDAILKNIAKLPSHEYQNNRRALARSLGMMPRELDRYVKTYL